MNSPHVLYLLSLLLNSVV